MDTLGKRIRHLRGRESQEDFARRIGVSKGSIGGYERDENSPSASAISKLCLNDNISVEWLLFGVGPMKAEGPFAARSLLRCKPHTGELEEQVRELTKRVAQLEREKENLERQGRLLAEKSDLAWEAKLARDKDVEHYRNIIDGLLAQLQTLTATRAPASAPCAPPAGPTGEK